MGIIEKTATWEGYCNAAQTININKAHTTQMTPWQCFPVVPSERNSRMMQCCCFVVAVVVVAIDVVVIFSRFGEEND